MFLNIFFLIFFSPYFPLYSDCYIYLVIGFYPTNAFYTRICACVHIRTSHVWISELQSSLSIDIVAVTWNLLASCLHLYRSFVSRTAISKLHQSKNHTMFITKAYVRGLMVVAGLLIGATQSTGIVWHIESVLIFILWNKSSLAPSRLF